MTENLDSSFNRMRLDSNSTTNHTADHLPPTARECLVQAIGQVNDQDIRQRLERELTRVLTDHERLVTMLQQRAQMLEAQNEQLKREARDQHHRYEKAVREMQFFRQRVDVLSKAAHQQQRRESISSEAPSEVSSSSSSHSHPTGRPSAAVQPPPPNTPLPALPPPGVTFPLTPTSPQPSSLNSDIMVRLSRSSSTASSSAAHTPTMPSGASVTSSSASSSSGSVRYHRAPPPVMHSSVSMDSPRHLRHNPSISSSSTSSGHPLSPTQQAFGASATTTAASPMILQRRVDPLMFGGSDALWDTIAKSRGNDLIVEKMISNFVRRGGSPNTAKQSPSAKDVKYGYGMIHALVVTRTPGALDLLLQHGANPNAISIADDENDKVMPCYLAAKVGWLAGLQRLVQAGGDLVRAQGPGGKTALHAAAEHGHMTTVEFIVGYTEGALNQQVDGHGATALHYACHAGQPDLVSFLARSCHISAAHADSRGEQPIHWAARAGSFEIISMLVERFGCDVNAYVPKRVPTPLDVAKTAGHKHLVEYIKSLGGLSTKKADKKREEERIRKASPTAHLQSTLAMNGLGRF